MSYWANPFDSKAGYEVLMTTFKSIYVDSHTNKIIDDSMSRSVKHFVDDFFLPGLGRGASALRTQAFSYDTLGKDHSEDSGIYRCRCGRIGYLWDWEYLDFSIYEDALWDRNAVTLKPKPGGMYRGKAYRVMAQVRCNEVSICSRCGVTYLAPESDITQCQACGAGPIEGEDDGQGMVQAGCGQQSWVEHFIPPVTEAQSFNFSTDWVSQASIGHFVDLRKPKALTVKIPRRIGIRSFEIRWAGDSRASWDRRQGTVCKTRQEAMVWVPKLSIILDKANASGLGTNVAPLEFPISLFGGYSDKESILYPGRTAFAGSQLHVSKDPSQAGKPLYYFGGNRAPGMGGGTGISTVDGRRGGGFVVPLKYLSVQGITRCALLPSSQNPIPWKDFTTRIFRFNPQRGMWNVDDLGEFVRREKYEFNSLDPLSGNHLPVYQFRTQQVSGAEVVNLKDPGMRSIDDRGLLRVTTISLNPIPTLPSEFDQDRPQVGSPIVCPNDIVYAIDMQRQLVDNAGRFLDRVRARLESVSAGHLTYGGSEYPFGITPLDIPRPPPAPELVETLLSFGFDIPSEAPGSGFSFLITQNRARAGVKVGNRQYPAFHRRSNGTLVPWREDLVNLWNVPDDQAIYDGGSLVDNLFYAPGYGSGTRRDGTYSAAPQYPRFGSVIRGREFIEDPYHVGSGFMPLHNLLAHEMRSIGRPRIDITLNQKYQSHYCNTCAGTLHNGSIVNVRANQGVVTDVELDDKGFPIRWIFIEGNQRGLAEWMVAAEAAYEGNRTLDFCPDGVDIDPEDSSAGRYRFYLIPDDDGIEDFRYDEPMIFIREDELSRISGYEWHDQEEVVINGISWPRPNARSSYLLGPPNQNPAGSPLSRSGDGRIVSIVEADGPMRRSGFINVPGVAGFGSSGRAYTTGAMPMIDPRATRWIYDDDDDEDDEDSWWERDWEEYDAGWDWGDDDRGFDPDEEFDPDEW